MLIVPAIDLIDGQCVRLYRGDFQKQVTYENDPVEQARTFQSAGFARLHVVDLEGARSGSGQNRDVIARIVEATDIPVEVGGGIRSRQDAAELLEIGTRYLILGTSVLSDPEEVGKWIETWGPDPFIVSLDLRGERLQSQGWLEQSEVKLQEAISRIETWGITQVICTDVDQDGTLEQPNYATYRDLLRRLAANVTLIAAGGVSCLEHISGLEKIGVGGAVVGRALYEGTIAIEDLARAG